MKKVIYISGTRADFNLMTKSLLELKKFVDLIILATGMHLSEKWGNTIREIEEYNFKIVKTDLKPENDSLSDMVKNTALETIKIAEIIENIKPNLIFVEGDRGEALAGAMVGAFLNIPVVHHGGGDISDSIDNKIRYGITMFSDYHLTGNIESYNRLIKMGISDTQIFNVGEPGLDDIIAGEFTQKNEIIKKFNIDSKKQLLLLIFHPNTKEFDSIEAQIVQILEAIKSLKIPTIALYSNADAGGKIINKNLDDYESELPFLSVYKHIFRKDFYGLMSVCNAMFGNSTAGITELPLFKKPFICVGTRQKGRLKTDNVIEVDYNKEDIIQAITKGLYDKEFKEELKTLVNPYGDGKSYLKITNIIRRVLKIMD